FKEKVNVADAAPGSNVSERGQFFWGRQLGLVVEAELNRMASEPGAAVFVGRARAIFNNIMSFQDVPNHAWMQLIGMAQHSTSSEKSAMVALLHSGLNGLETEHQLWIVLNAQPDNILPDLKPWRSLPILATLRQIEKRGCGPQVMMVAKRLKNKGGIT